VVHVPGEDVFTLCCVHVPCIGAAIPLLEGPTPI
jgi:hypothetical protein